MGDLGVPLPCVIVVLGPMEARPSNEGSQSRTTTATSYKAHSRVSICDMIQCDACGTLISCLNELLRTRRGTAARESSEDRRSPKTIVMSYKTDFWVSTGYQILYECFPSLVGNRTSFEGQEEVCPGE